MKLTHSFYIGEDEYIGRCTFRAICDFEEKSGMSIGEAWKTLAEGNIKVSIIAAAIWAFVNGERVYSGHSKEPFDVIGQKIHLYGFHTMLPIVVEFFKMTLPQSDSECRNDGEKKSIE